MREYELQEKLGEGGMGAVYRARHTKLDRPVAVKMLPSNLLASGSGGRPLRARNAGGRKLDHRNIVRAYDAGEVDNLHYLVLELLDGMELGDLASSLGKLPLADACEIVRQAATGLEHAHQHGLVHRDVKPANLVLTSDGTVKVLDLGLALLHDQTDEEITATGQVMGTLDYMAPEQWDDTHSVDIRTDVYALGCTLYRLLAGAPPFSGDAYKSPARKLIAHTTEPPPTHRSASRRHSTRPDAGD